MIRARLLSHAMSTLREACEAEEAAMVIAVEGVDGLKVTGPTATQVAHLYAVAALVAADRAESDLRAVVECTELAAAAVFIMGREDIHRRSIEKSRKKKAADGARGGRPQTITDAQVLAEWNAYLRAHGDPPPHGALVRVASRLGIDPKSLTVRLRKLALRK